MNRRLTNSIRFIMDELLPPRLRDSRWFMYPFFHIWFKGKNVETYMDFKDIAYELTEEQFTNVYKNLDCRASDRPTDLNTQSINYMIRNLHPDAQTLLDVGCGRGHWLQTLAQRTKLKLTGCDLKTPKPDQQITYVQGSINKLPFPDNSFDIVTCHHTIEHLRDLPTAITELKRIARKQLIIATPCQRCYFYTLDLHLQFFPIASTLSNAIGMKHYELKEIHGDWVFTGDTQAEKAEKSKSGQHIEPPLPVSA